MEIKIHRRQFLQNNQILRRICKKSLRFFFKVRDVTPKTKTQAQKQYLISISPVPASTHLQRKRAKKSPRFLKENDNEQSLNHIKLTD